MLLKNNRWYDDSNNSWSADVETEESAQIKSKTLINCSDCSDCSYCSYCRGCSYCSYCSGCSGCSGCSYFTSNPFRLFFQGIGSRNSETQIYWLCDRSQVKCGCFSGSLLEFEAAVTLTHGDNEHGQRYQAIINQVWQLMEV